MKKFWIDILIVGIITIGAFFYVMQQENSQKIKQLSAPSPTSAHSISSDSGNIIVTKPLANESIDIPLSITGKARVFENVLQYRVKDNKGKIIAFGKATA